MSWFSDAVSWATDAVQGVQNWISDQVGDVWDGVGSSLGFETEAQRMRRQQTPCWLPECHKVKRR